MNTELLKSKVHVPIVPQETIQRAGLLHELESAVPEHKLILVSAPAGYGKTTLLAEWARETQGLAAWLSIEPDDNDAVRFFRYLLAAWETVQPEVIHTPLGLLLSSRMPDMQAVLPAFLQAADQAPPHLTFILDDFHLILDPAVHEALTFLLDHLPPHVHFILAGRGEPPLPLARYRARRQLAEFRVDDLRFSEAECGQFFDRQVGLDVSTGDAASIYQQTEGWIAGLQLAMLSLRRSYSAPAGRPLASGRQRFIADYLAVEVLQQLPAALLDFLLKTSILERLCGSLCDAVTAETGGQATLAALEGENLFLIPLDDERHWFRYHSLFAEFLQDELRRRMPDAVETLHSRAARWYLAHDLPEQAFQHAVAGNNVDLGIKIFNDYANAKLMAGELRVLDHWFTSLPAEWVTAYPVFNLMRAGYFAYTGEREAGVRCVDEAEQKLTPVENEDQRWQMARVTAVRCLMACEQNDLTRAYSFAQRALDELPADDLGFRPGIYAALGDTYRNRGLWDEARDCYLKVLEFTQSPPVKVRAAHTYGALADLALMQGHLKEADEYWQKALVVIEAQGLWSSCELPVIGWVYIRMGEILYEWDQKEQAGERILRGLERAELGGDKRTLIAGYLAASRLKLSKGDLAAAEDYLEQARPLVEQSSFPDWASRFRRLHLDLLLAQDKVGPALHGAESMLQKAAEGGSLEREAAHLAAARVLVVKRDTASLKRARLLLEPVLETSQAEGRRGILIEALALKALVEQLLGSQPGGMTALEQALRLAEPEGFVRLFVDLGLPMARLLQEARSREVMPEYVNRLLAAFKGGPAAADGALPEPLTLREQQVLKLMAAGLTNHEIARELVISAETVKKHTGSIIGKLGVNNRTQAVAKARVLDIIE